MNTGTTRDTGVFQVAKHRRAAVRVTDGGAIELHSTQGRRHRRKLLAYVACPLRIDPHGRLHCIAASAWEQLRRLHALPAGREAYLRIAPDGQNGWTVQVAAIGANAKVKVVLPTTPGDPQVWEKAIEVACRKAHLAVLSRSPGTTPEQLASAQSKLQTQQLALLAMVR